MSRRSGPRPGAAATVGDIWSGQERCAGPVQGPDGRLVLGQQGGRNRAVVERRGILLAVVDRPPQEVDQGVGPILGLENLGQVLVDDQPGRAGDRVALGGVRIGEVEAQVRRVGREVRGRGQRVERRRDAVAALVLDVGERDVVLEGVGELDVADAAVGLVDALRDAFVAAGAETGRPLDRLAGRLGRIARRRRSSPSPGSPSVRYVVKMLVVPEPSERWTTLMSVLGRLTPGFERGDRRVVPVRDLAVEDAGDDVRRHLDRSRQALEVVGDHDSAEGDRDLDRHAVGRGGWISESARKASDAPKSTVFGCHCLMPPPEPIDW